MHPFLIVLTTLPNLEEAKTLARQLIENRLAACVQIQEGVCSIYSWNNQICEETEVLLSAKTSVKQWAAIESFIQKHHSYELPEIIAISPKEYSKTYGAWVSEVLK